MGFNFGKIVQIFKFIVKVIQAGHDEGLWDKSQVIETGTPDNAKIVKLFEAVSDKE